MNHWLLSEIGWPRYCNLAPDYRKFHQNLILGKEDLVLSGKITI
jgi:hypothetical protein